ncbi:hypothetical protein G6W59_06500 [Streptomyces odorifer]|uniref:Flp pilus assembly protein RcpC/CpaB domain-containing protein n=1 Tax=Streptomyces odorifer TaxID=53450 RepID=A0A7Y6C6L4_9ACTN|nr:hypothetical protein [Streptomyces odorifer]NUV32974.1 hypothetical protein [Streptomyces sp. KAI-27]NUV46496.1 hypothetical protein [Streptomyces sp. CAI-78]
MPSYAPDSIPVAVSSLASPTAPSSHGPADAAVRAGLAPAPPAGDPSLCLDRPPAVPGYGVPPPGRVVPFAPVRIRGGARLGRAGRWRGWDVVAGLLVGAVWWAVPGVQASRGAPGGEAAGGATASERVEVAGTGARAGAGSAAGRFVTAPVRLADGGAAGLLRAGDRVDVLAPAQDRAGGGRGHKARRIASCAEVLRVPGAAVRDGSREAGVREDRAADGAPWPEFGDPGGSREGLVLLRVRRATAEALAGAAMGVPAASGAGSGAHLVVTVC